MDEQATFTARHLINALSGTFLKLNPRLQLRNPVMFVVFIGAIVVSALWMQTLITHEDVDAQPTWFILWVAVWLWFTVLFANFAEAIAEGKGKAQASSLRSLRRDVSAKKLRSRHNREDMQIISAADLRKDDLVYVEAGDFIPGDGQVMEGIASVDESAITGESAPVIRESGGDSDAVTGGTRLLSDWLVIRIGANPGESFLDKMVGLVEGAKRQKLRFPFCLLHLPWFSCLRLPRCYHFHCMLFLMREKVRQLALPY